MICTRFDELEGLPLKTAVFLVWTGAPLVSFYVPNGLTTEDIISELSFIEAWGFEGKLLVIIEFWGMPL